MANNTCHSLIQMCMTRSALLNASGAPTGGANSGYIFDQTIELGISIVVSEGETIEKRNGCDTICATLTNQDRIQRIDLSLTLCTLDAEFISQLTGGTLITDGGDTIGMKFPGPTDDVGGNGVAMDFYAKAWDSDSQADDGVDVIYTHFVFPKVTWVLGNLTVNRDDFSEIPLTGKAVVNNSIFDGAWDDYPTNMNGIGGFFNDTVLPTAECGRVTLPAGS